MLILLGMALVLLSAIVWYHLEKRNISRNEAERDTMEICPEELERIYRKEKQSEKKRQIELEYRDLYYELFPKCPECEEDPESRRYISYGFCPEEIYDSCRECHKPIAREIEKEFVLKKIVKLNKATS